MKYCAQYKIFIGFYLYIYIYNILAYLPKMKVAHITK